MQWFFNLFSTFLGFERRDIAEHVHEDGDASKCPFLTREAPPVQEDKVHPDVRRVIAKAKPGDTIVLPKSWYENEDNKQALNAAPVSIIALNTDKLNNAAIVGTYSYINYLPGAIKPA